MGSGHYQNSMVLGPFLESVRPSKVCLSNRKGIEDVAERWAKAWQVPVQRYFAGSRKAPSPRAYLVKAEPDLVVWLPGDDWSESVVSEARDMGIRLLEVPH